MSVMEQNAPSSRRYFNFKNYFILLILLFIVTFQIFKNIEYSNNSYLDNQIPPNKVLFDVVCKALINENKNYGCKYHENKYKCCLYGNNISFIPQNLTEQVNKLIIFNASLTSIKHNDLKRYPRLEDLYISHCNNLNIIDGAVFDGLQQLKNLTIINNFNLEEITGVLFKSNFRISRLIVSNNALKRLPGIEMPSQHRSMEIIDFSYNQIEYIGDRHLKNINAKVVKLNNNELKETGSQIFANCKFGKLYMNDNPELKRMSKNVFDKLDHLYLLNLSSTALSELPITGLKNLKKLSIRNTEKIKKLPPILSFTSLEYADFTYPYHCCLFKYAKRIIEKDKDTFMNNYHEIQKRVCEKNEKEGNIHNNKHNRIFRSTNTEKYIMNEESGNHMDNPLLGMSSHLIDEDDKKLISYDEEMKVDDCNNRAVLDFYQNITCNPMPDDLNPCEDIVGYPFLRIVIWIVGFLAIVGNIGVWVVLLTVKNKRMKLHYIFMMNLSLADLLTGCYLAILAIMDHLTANEYYNHAVEWQTGWGCMVAGFLSVFASELSIISMFMIAFEIFYNTKYAFYGKLMRSKLAYPMIFFGYAFATTMATLPLFGISSYQRTSICLPLSIQNRWDQIFIIFGLFFNLFAFVGMLLCYASIINMVKNLSTPRPEEDRQILIRTGLLIGTDLLCWMPTLFFGITAALHTPLISLTKAKICLIIFYPINSCANPFLYVFLTKVVQKDVKEKALPILSRLSLGPDKSSTSINSLSKFYNSQPPDQTGSHMSSKNSQSRELLEASDSSYTELKDIKISGCEVPSNGIIHNPQNYYPRKSSRVSFQDEVLMKGATHSKHCPGRKMSIGPRKRVSAKPEMSDISENSTSLNLEEKDRHRENNNDKLINKFSLKSIYKSALRNKSISSSRRDSGRGESFSSATSRPSKDDCICNALFQAANATALLKIKGYEKEPMLKEKDINCEIFITNSESSESSDGGQMTSDEINNYTDGDLSDDEGSTSEETTKISSFPSTTTPLFKRHFFENGKRRAYTLSYTQESPVSSTTTRPKRSRTFYIGS
uniref:G_PROTEIN_RECEP_F1_2 domain-containing protein n=1 Tax=Parastrongyloides trichosuri TaxID=131310 RepID=A0A0N5A2T8_PARTI